jgi:hypothetical protein
MIRPLARAHLEEEHGFEPDPNKLMYDYRGMHQSQHLNEGQFLNHTHPDLQEPAPKYQPTLGDFPLVNDRRSS